MKKIWITFTIILVLVLSSPTSLVKAGTIPTISIMGVTQADKVTVETHNFPANKDFQARMGLLGTKGVDGVLVGTVNSGEGGKQIFTFEIPEDLQSENAIAIRLDSTSGGYYAYNWFYNKTFGSHEESTPTPTLTILSVKKDESVTVKGVDFPSGETFDILMGKEGTEGIDGTVITTISIEEDGEFVMDVDIPEDLKSESKIAIRFESQDSDLVCFKTFENQTGASGGTTPTTTIPTISIVSVEEDQKVTVKTYNFPADKDFDVLMGMIGTRGVGGIKVTTINSGAGGTFEATFNIPEELKGLYQIAIRMQTSNGVYYAYNWFYNNITDGTPPPTGYTGIPTFSITGVVRDDTVTITTNNFPANYDFKVLMGKMFTKGINGVHVTTINSGPGGALEGTFDIPESLQGESRIAIRLESTSGGFYAYNWFYNTTYP